MALTVIEHALVPKDGDHGANEDALVVTDDFAFVVDGATSKTTRTYRGATGGRLVASAITEAVPSLPAAATLREVVDRLTEAVAETLAPEALPAERPSAVFAAYSRARHEIWRVGDCSWRAGTRVLLGSKKLDQVAAAARATLLRAHRLAGRSLDELCRSDPGRQMILPLLREQHRFANLATDEPLAYGVIDGRPVPDRFLESFPFEGDEVILATDGYPTLLPTLAETELALRDELERDPLRIERHASTKAVVPGAGSFDDRTYLRVAVR